MVWVILLTVFLSLGESAWQSSGEFPAALWAVAGCQELSLRLAPTWEPTTPPLVSAPITTGGTVCELMREDVFSIFPKKADQSHPAAAAWGSGGHKGENSPSQAGHPGRRVGKLQCPPASPVLRPGLGPQSCETILRGSSCHSRERGMSPPGALSRTSVSPAPLNRGQKRGRARNGSPPAGLSPMRALVPAPLEQALSPLVSGQVPTTARATTTGHELPRAPVWSDGRFSPHSQQTCGLTEGSLLKRCVGSPAYSSRHRKGGTLPQVGQCRGRALEARESAEPERAV